ncbi:hypothetical protein P170DRAFT_438263 [Aspergillus steynii IBT 23096]|uniref:histidine kinase n=1 Tax=Aspergillus steynii IBT 23096 TaxID=1392250 RepID=A0A2I2G0S9_9EURO|nr:uncharacterized protein P170DRAFT_438263 [Aspergillus steynii IBT 23096]PLB46487.1 hypothetical protein P170DRAFT_438263 [Aspergillus steynii IBT 23096]
MAAITENTGQSTYRLAQEREFFKFIPNDHSASHFAPFDHESRRSFVAQPSRDAALTSFAQLGAIRLGARRALVSLFDRTYQHVLTEATPTLSLIGGHVRDERDNLRVGSCVFPRERGLCTLVSTLPSPDYNEDSAVVDGSAVVVPDVTQEERFKCAELLGLLSDVRFYAAVPIVSPRGLTIGAYSVWDDQPRPEGVDTYSLQFLKDMAATVMEHLEGQHARHKSQLAERMIVGLGSFVEGRATLRHSWREANAQFAASEQSGETTEGQLNIHQQDLEEQGQGTKKETEAADIQNTGQSIRSVFAGEDSPQDVLSTGIQRVFSRAANLIRESIGAEGVVFLDTNSERFGDLIENKTNRKVTGSGNNDSPESSDESSDSGSSSRRHQSSGSEEEGTKSVPVCVSLGFSTSRASSINDEVMASNQVVVQEPLLTSWLRRYPRGKIFTYNANRSVSDDSDDTLGSVVTPEQPNQNSEMGGAERRSSSKKRRKPNFRQDAGNLIRIFPDARNIILLPMWDTERRRCFAGALVWTNNPERVFTIENELAYLFAFSNSIMAEIRRLDVEMAEKAKTNLVSSITHELRNPLHGILGTADILSDTAMNALQHGMVHTIESCGRTLLDTINNLLDLTFIDKYQKRRSSKHQAKQRQLPSGESQEDSGVKSSRNKKAPAYTHVKLDQVLEEVTECVFAGYSFYHHPQAPPPALADSSSRATGETNQITIVFDIQPDIEWGFYTHAGAWRRILMNVFGNALKYTSSGFIYLQLQCTKSKHKSRKRSDPSGDEQPEEYEVTLTVKDTGKGIGPEYLQQDLFTPFTQENPLASGSGLGLSIVRQAVGALGGSIEINSTKGVGTELTIRTPLTHYPSATSDNSSDAVFVSLRKSTEGKSIGLLGFGSSLESNRDTTLYTSLARVCEEWFGLEVTSVSQIIGEKRPFNFYLAVQTELDSEDLEGRNLFNLAPQLCSQGDETPIVVVICQSPEEAHSMFVAAKNRGINSIFEFVSQPCGPRKLARALELCIKRRRDDESGRRVSDEPTRWVEMPESSHLPVDVGPSDPPNERLKVSKRPTTDTMGSPEETSLQKAVAEGNWEVTLPNRSGQPSPTTQDDKGTDEPAPPVPKSVLLVDDNDLNLQLLCAYTKKDGRDYVTGKDGAEAVETYRSDPGRFRVVVIDISMPVMNGFEASREIRRIEKEHRAKLSEAEREKLPYTIITALTGLDSANAQKEAYGSGIDSFLIKPIKRLDLLDILKNIDQ